MTYEEAFQYCLEKDFRIFFVPIKSKDGENTPHICTPRFFMENCNKTFPDVVEDIKTRIEREEKAENLLLKKSGGEPVPYDKVMKEAGTIR